MKESNPKSNPKSNFHMVICKERGNPPRFYFFNDLGTSMCCDRHEKSTTHYTFTREELEQELEEESHVDQMNRILPELYTEEELNSPEPDEYKEVDHA